MLFYNYIIKTEKHPIKKVSNKGAKMKYKLKDGYVELSKSGNTYSGKMAHKIMHAAERIQRKAQRKFKSDISFNDCLVAILNEFNKVAA